MPKHLTTLDIPSLMTRTEAEQTVSQLDSEIDDLQSKKADKSTVTSLGTSVNRLTTTRSTVAAISDVPAVPSAGSGLNIVGLGLAVSLDSFNALRTYTQQIGHLLQSVISAHRQP